MSNNVLNPDRKETKNHSLLVHLDNLPKKVNRIFNIYNTPENRKTGVHSYKNIEQELVSQSHWWTFGKDAREYKGCHVMVEIKSAHPNLYRKISGEKSGGKKKKSWNS